MSRTSSSPLAETRALYGTLQQWGENRNYYSDARLIAAGGDPLGVLDFYTVHYYAWGSTQISPFHHDASFWGLDKPLVLFRKQGKLPADVLAEGYQTEYGEAFLEVHADSLCEGDSVVMFDDLIATGGTPHVPQLPGREHVLTSDDMFDLDERGEFVLEEDKDRYVHQNIHCDVLVAGGGVAGLAAALAAGRAPGQPHDVAHTPAIRSGMTYANASMYCAQSPLKFEAKSM